MKKLIALMLALVLVVGLCACGDKGGNVAGRYYLVSMSEGGESYTVKEYSEMLGAEVEMYIDVKADGTATAKNMDGEYMEMGWGNGQMWPADEPGEKANCTFRGDTMTISQDGMTMTFKKG